MSRYYRYLRILAAYFGFLIFAFLAISMTLRGIWLSLPAIFVMIITPGLDLVSTKDKASFLDADFTKIERTLLNAAPVLFGMLYCGSVITMAYRFPLLSGFEKIAVISSSGIIGSIAITAAHELVHKTDQYRKWFGRIILCFVGYMHFEINHIEGHHLNACTDQDESTGWLDENVYEYVFRTIPACYLLSWRLELQRMQRRARGFVSFRNRMILATLGPSGIFLGLLFGQGWQSALFYVGQSCIAIFMLEVVAFVEHYGLMRSLMNDGKRERMTAVHSWNSYHRFSNYLTFNLPRHADHHSNATKPYYALLIDETSPELPFGYPIMIAIALIPALWRKVIHLPEKSSDNR